MKSAPSCAQNGVIIYYINKYFLYIIINTLSVISQARPVSLYITLFSELKLGVGSFGRTRSVVLSSGLAKQVVLELVLTWSTKKFKGAHHVTGEQLTRAHQRVHGGFDE